jgi:hypothetical protein
MWTDLYLILALMSNLVFFYTDTYPRFISDQQIYDIFLSTWQVFSLCSSAVRCCKVEA